MRIGTALGLLLAFALLPADAPKIDPNAPNLIPNGDFEKGDLTPSGWQTVDGLTAFYVKDDDPKRGKVIKFDTDVLQSQGYEWWSKIASGASPKDAPKKTPTVEPKYDTLAGLDGVWFWSDPIPIEKGKSYWLTIDVKGPPILVWLVGYPEEPSTDFGADEGGDRATLPCDGRATAGAVEAGLPDREAITGGWFTTLTSIRTASATK